MQLGVNKYRKILLAAAIFVAVFFFAIAYFALELGPADSSSSGLLVFRVKAGDGLREIAASLVAEHLIKSRAAFEIWAVLNGSATVLKPGNYRLSRSMTSREIIAELTAGSRREISVTIPEGLSSYEIEKILTDAGVIETGGIVGLKSSTTIEGMLFPDTYRFFTDSEPQEVVNKFLENFKAKAGPLLEGKNSPETNLILASLVEKEVPDFEDQRIVAGILKKRIAAGVPLQVDATICYIKATRSYPDNPPCYPLSPLDFKIDSPYNTYLHRGLPPGPIGNPGVSAINAALNPQKSPYWYYLSEPATRKTIFSKTLDEQEENRVKYLKGK